jgi:hypothetical protein
MCTKPERLRMAILPLTDMHKEGMTKVTPQDVQKKWDFLAGVWGGPKDIADLANGSDIDDDLFEELMTALRSSF